MIRWRLELILLCVMYVLCAVANAQMNVAEITGAVVDMSGGAIVRAAIAAVNTATNAKFTSVTDVSGRFQVAELPPGDYSLVVAADGFQPEERHLTVHAGDRFNQTFTLTVEQHTQVVVVEGTTGPLQAESAEVKDVIENQQVADLPVRDREFLELAMLGPGVANPPGGTRGDSLQQTGKLINILGQRTGHNLFLVDGVSVTDQYYNNVVLSPSPDDTREFSIAKTNYDAEFGGKSGGVVNVITQSGTDAFHGSLYEFLRNNALDARNFFDGPGAAPPFHENQFGGAFGGPIVKDKTFFFLNYDGQRTIQSVADVFTSPTQAEREGIFPAPIVSPATGQLFPNNTINTPLDPAAVALLARVPLPNLPGAVNNLRSVEQQRVATDEVNVRLDHRLSDRDNLWARGSVFFANEFDPFGSSVLNEALLPGFGRTLAEFSASYTFSKTFDNASDFNEQPQNPYALGAEWALSQQDQRHRLVFNALWELPIGDEEKGQQPKDDWVTKVFGHLEVAPIFTAESGWPVNPLTGLDTNLSDALPLSSRPAGFGRDSFRSPALVNLDFRVLKYFPFGDTAKLDLVAEAFNLVNRTNVAQVNPIFGPQAIAMSGFLQPLSAVGARRLEFSLDFEF